MNLPRVHDYEPLLWLVAGMDYDVLVTHLMFTTFHQDIGYPIHC